MTTPTAALAEIRNIVDENYDVDTHALHAIGHVLDRASATARVKPEHAPLTVADLVALGRLLEATSVRRVRWVDDHGDLHEGVARCFAHDGGGFLNSGEDVRDAYLHVSGTFEQWLPVRELIPMVKEGTFVVEGAS